MKGTPLQRALLMAGIAFGPALASMMGHAATPSPAAPIAAAAQEVRVAAGAHRLILLGELHGTREAPALAQALVEAYAQEGPVVLALEMDAGEQPAFKRFLASDGGAGARATLLSGPFWHVSLDHHDGRRNWEAVALIDAVRRLRADARDVAVLAMDTGSLGTGTTASSQARDKAMAERLRVVFEHLPRGRMLVLTGNVHAMRTRPQYAPPEMQRPMGSYLDDLSPYSVDIGASGGSYWACMENTCGPQAMPHLPIQSGARDGDPYDYQLVLPAYSVARLVGVVPDPAGGQP